MCTILYSELDIDTAQIAVRALVTGEQRVLVSGGSYPRYAPTGHIVYGFQGTLRAVPFDADQLTVTGDPVSILEGVRTLNTGAADFALAQDGSLVYVAGAAGVASTRTLVWVDRQGREEPVGAPPGIHFDPRLSPDGGQIALATDDDAGNTDVWTFDTAGGRRRRITFDPALDRYPLWTSDGLALLFSSARDGTLGVYRKGLDADRAVEPFFSDPSNRGVTPWSWSADGQTLVMSELAAQGDSGFDVGAVTVGGERTRTGLLESAFEESEPVVSPDGQWMAYSSTERGGDSGVYVRPFPDVTAGVEQVSTEGGANPHWTRDGRELVYRNGDTIMAVPIELSPAFRAGTPEVLFSGTYFDGIGDQWDVTRDGNRFLMLKPVAASDAAGQEQALPQIILVQNWFEELRRLVPTN